MAIGIVIAAMQGIVALAAVVIEVRVGVATQGDALALDAIDARTHRDFFRGTDGVTNAAVVHVRRGVDADSVAFLIIGFADADRADTGFRLVAGFFVRSATGIRIGFACFVIKVISGFAVRGLAFSLCAECIVDAVRGQTIVLVRAAYFRRIFDTGVVF